MCIRVPNIIHLFIFGWPQKHNLMWFLNKNLLLIDTRKSGCNNPSNRGRYAHLAVSTFFAISTMPWPNARGCNHPQKCFFC